MIKWFKKLFAKKVPLSDVIIAESDNIKTELKPGDTISGKDFPPVPEELHNIDLTESFRKQLSNKSVSTAPAPVPRAAAPAQGKIPESENVLHSVLVERKSYKAFIGNPRKRRQQLRRQMRLNNAKA